MECVKIDLLTGAGWRLYMQFSDSNPVLDRNLFAATFEKEYRCTIMHDVHLDNWYVEFTPEAWTWFCLQHDLDSFNIIE